MTSPADQTIAALRSGHDELSTMVRRLDPGDLTHPTAASEWDVSQVLSHLGSGAVIGLAALDAALTGGDPPDADFNKGIWARWDAMSPGERGENFEPTNRRLVERFESLDPTQRNELRIDLGFLPAPVDVATAAALRLNEFALHAWDIKVAFEPTTTLAAEAVPAMFDPVRMILGFVAHADAVAARPVTIAVRLTDPVRSLGLRIDDGVSLTDASDDADGELRAPAEAWLRLVTGRLAPRHTPDAVTITGPLDLDDLRRVFPGF